MPPKKRTSSLDFDDVLKPELSSGSDKHAAPSSKKPRGAPANADAHADAGGAKKFSLKGKGRPWTSAEYVQLFQRVEELGKKAAFESFPGRTKNQAYQAWR